MKETIPIEAPDADARGGRASALGLTALAALGMALAALAQVATGHAFGSQSGPAGERLGDLPLVSPQESLFQVPAPPAPEDVIMLQLRDGGIRWGAIQEHDPAGMRFTLLDTGGVVRLPWTMLNPGQSEALRTRFGYVAVEADEAYVDGSRLILEGGGTVEGVIVSREGNNFLIRTEGNLQMLPKNRVRNVESGVQLPALDVYSVEDLYGLYLAETDVESAESQLALARKCESILDFVHAVTHYEAALELGLPGDPAQVEGVLTLARVKAQNQTQLAYLREADRLRKRGRFDQAQAMLRAFDTTFAGSALVEDARKQEVRLLKDRDAAASKLVRSRWLYWTRKLSRAQASQDNFEAARNWVTERASDEIRQRVLDDIQRSVTADASLEDVRRLWEERDRGRYESTTFGVGTWLLGEARANAGGEAEETPAEAVSQVDEQRRAIEERVKRYLDNQRIARRSSASEEEADLTQQFWETWSTNGRSLWLMSYYVEESGDYDVRVRPSLRACRTCAGQGALELLVTGTVTRGESASLSLCPLCRGVRVTRRVYFR